MQARMLLAEIPTAGAELLLDDPLLGDGFLED
jgi:hypothetical protein